jgi:hypothetical protein
MSRYAVSRVRVRRPRRSVLTVRSVVGKKQKGAEALDVPFDLAARIGMPDLTRPAPAAPEPVRRVDGPIESDRATRARPLLIGANEAPATPVEVREPERPAAASAGRPLMIGLDEIFAPPPVAPVPEPALSEGASAGPAIVTPREAPLIGEMDLVVTPLATPDDWHHFELALRRLPGVGALRIEYYRAGILKLRLQWTGAQRFAYAVANVPGYRVGILGEDRSTVQIRVARSG